MNRLKASNYNKILSNKLKKVMYPKRKIVLKLQLIKQEMNIINH